PRNERSLPILPDTDTQLSPRTLSRPPRDTKRSDQTAPRSPPPPSKDSARSKSLALRSSKHTHTPPPSPDLRPRTPRSPASWHAPGSIASPAPALPIVDR